MSFLTYLDDFEKKFEAPKVIEQPKTITQTKVEKQVIKEITKPKKLVKIIKKPFVKEHISKAASILDGIESCGSGMLPLSSRFYDDEKEEPNKLKESKNVANLANDLLDGDSSGSSYSVNDNDPDLKVRGSLPAPLMNVPEVDLDILRYVPQEMLTEQQRFQVQMLQPKTNENNSQPQKEPEIPPEIQRLMEDTQRLQAMCMNVQMPQMPENY
jgi:hypothetical protein